MSDNNKDKNPKDDSKTPENNAGPDTTPKDSAETGKPEEEKSLQDLINDMYDDADDAQEELGADSAKFQEAVDAAVEEATKAIKSEAKEEIAQIRKRAVDEVESVRKRADQDADAAKNKAVGKFAKDMLEFADNFHRAVEAIPAEDAENNEQLKKILDGLHAMESSLQAAFNRHGIEKFESKGQKFDPNKHEAMFQIPATDGQEPGTVGQVAQEGYMMNGRLLRAARVGVVK